MAGLFDSAWLKWGRAVGHAQALDAEIERVTLDSYGEPFATFTEEYNPERHGFAVTVETVEPIPPMWNLLLGDVVHNFHCALDHLAWALVQRGTKWNALNDEQKGRIYFPIAKSASHLKKMIPRKLPGIRRADLTIVRRAQPYRRGKTRVRWHCFTLLERMSNSDKHREIQGLWMVPDCSEYEILETRDCVVTSDTLTGRRGLLKVGTEVAFIRVRKTGPQPKIQVKYKVASYPCFNERLWLKHWMHVATVESGRLLQEFADPPSALDALPPFGVWLRGAIDTWTRMAGIWAAKRAGGNPALGAFSLSPPS